MRWNEFCVALGAALDDLPTDGFFVITEKVPNGKFVQFVDLGDVLHAEVGSGTGKGRWARLLSARSEDERARERDWALVEERLAAAGWSPPRRKVWPNWWRDAPASRRAEYEELAGAVTWVLEVLFKVPAPSDLQYTAWMNEPHQEIEFDSLGRLLQRHPAP